MGIEPEGFQSRLHLGVLYMGRSKKRPAVDGSIRAQVMGSKAQERGIAWAFRCS